MNKTALYSVLVVAILGLGLWWVTANTKPGDQYAFSPSISASASPSASPTPTPAGPNIVITSPKANASVDSPILVTGRARVFENQLTVELKDASGNVVAQTHVFTNAPDAGQFGDFAASLEIPPNKATAAMKVEAFALSPKGDGSLQGDAIVSVNLKYTDTMIVYAAFLTGNDCTTTMLLPRLITKTAQFVPSSVAELLKGPNPVEISDDNAHTAIPDGTIMNSFKQTGNVVTVDFNSTINQGVTAGSCKAQSIVAQITDTLKQFLGISTVNITVNGKPDTILQSQ